MPVINNKKGGNPVVRVTANTTITLADTAVPNSSVEEVTSLTINDIMWSGNCTIKRGANTLLVLQDSGYLDFAGTGKALTEDASANVVIEIAATGTVIMTLGKASNFTEHYV